MNDCLCGLDKNGFRRDILCPKHDGLIKIERLDPTDADSDTKYRTITVSRDEIARRWPRTD